MNKKVVLDLISKGNYLLAADILKEASANQTPAVGNQTFSPDVFSKWIAKPQEHFLVACLNFKQQLTRIVIAHIGTLDNTPVHPRDVFRIAILENAGFLVVAHNHPSGNSNPSEADLYLTEQLVKAGDVLRIPVLDHYILATTGVCSLRDVYPRLFEA